MPKPNKVVPGAQGKLKVGETAYNYVEWTGGNAHQIIKLVGNEEFLRFRESRNELDVWNGLSTRWSTAKKGDYVLKGKNSVIVFQRQAMNRALGK